MNLTIRPVKAPGIPCSSEDCGNSASDCVYDADSGAALVFYCLKHVGELRKFLESHAQ